MRKGRTALALLLSVSLAACGGGGGGGGSSPTPPTGGGTGPAPAPTPPPTAQCSLAQRQSWTLGQLDQFYLFPELLDRTVNPASFSTVQDYIDALVAPARAQSRDRFFTYITSIQEENALINSGSSAGFGIRLSYANNRLFVTEAFENAPGFAAGLDRGVEITAIDGVAVSTLFARGGAGAVSEALGPSEPGLRRSLRFTDTNGASREVSVTKADYALDPISDRNGVSIIDNGGTRVGYLNLRTFIVTSGAQQLRDAFSLFQQQGVTQVILDLRYNGGGLVSQGELLGSLLGRDFAGQVFGRTVFRDSRAGENRTALFTREAEAIGVTRLAIIGTSGTASASEMVANAFIPYLGNNVALIGSNTFGKPVGQIAVDRAQCDDRLRVLAFRTVNAAGQGDYYTGLASVFPRTCRAEDQLSRQFGDPQEASIRTALDFLAGRSCTPITGGGVQGAQAVRPAGDLLRTFNDNAAQREVPGLF
ncbi:S41 family peptidase [Porphyrobacter sp. GA68]|uniref:S41 family peptidase n=1 Tax=Porphyrobacter sp. GA68 TaxID=2883480 RepID=UPI001D1918D2|nr:S41 family peptidase [Porphyrobacter sp. GA68]